jgi:hypothetical protein
MMGTLSLRSSTINKDIPLSPESPNNKRLMSDVKNMIKINLMSPGVGKKFTSSNHG